MATPNELEHERHRFRTMSIAQLHTRLNRITKSNKLDAFIEIADECDGGYYNDSYARLAQEARIRRDFLIPSITRESGGVVHDRLYGRAGRVILRENNLSEDGGFIIPSELEAFNRLTEPGISAAKAGEALAKAMLDFDEDTSPPIPEKKIRVIRAKKK